MKWTPLIGMASRDPITGTRIRLGDDGDYTDAPEDVSARAIDAGPDFTDLATVGACFMQMEGAEVWNGIIIEGWRCTAIRDDGAFKADTRTEAIQLAWLAWNEANNATP